MAEGSSIRRRSTYTMLGVLAQGGFRVLVNVAIGRFAGATVLGQSAGILAAAQLLNLAGPTSLAAAQTRFVASAHAEGDSYRSGVIRYVRQRIVLILCLVSLPLGVGWGLVEGAAALEVALLIAITTGLVAYGNAKSHLLGLSRFGRLAASEIATATLGLLATAALVAAGVRDLNLLWPVAATAWLCAIWNWLPSGSGAIPSPVRREIATFAALGVLGTLVSAGFLQSSVLIASTVIGGAGAGHYAAAFALATPLSIITTSIGMVLFPTFSRMLSDTEKTGQLLATVSRAMANVLVPGACLVMAVSPEVTKVVWGDGFAPTSLVLPLMICAVALTGVGMPGSQALTSTGVTGMRDSVKVGLLGAGAGGAIWVMSVGHHGALGLAAGYLAGTVATSFLPLAIMTKRLHSTQGAFLYFLLGWAVPIAVSVATVLHVHNGHGVLARLGTATAGIAVWWLIGRLRARPELHRFRALPR